jgi:hypothetical protein
MCLFAFPFPTKYQLSAFLEGSLTSERNVLIQFFVDNLGAPFSVCDTRTDCFFFHTRPFILKISGRVGRSFTMILKYETDTAQFSTNPCYLGPIPLLSGAKAGDISGLTVDYRCEDERHKRAQQFRMVFGISLLLGVLCAALHLFGVINLKVLAGLDDEVPLIAKAKVPDSGGGHP